MSSLGGSTNIKTQINNLWGAIRNLKGTVDSKGSGNVVYSGNDTPEKYGQHYVISSSDGKSCSDSSLHEDTNGFSFNNLPLMNIDTITANSFIKSGGTSSQFLKANGSVDSSRMWLKQM